MIAVYNLIINLLTIIRAELLKPFLFIGGHTHTHTQTYTHIDTHGAIQTHTHTQCMHRLGVHSITLRLTVLQSIPSCSSVRLA